jgi:hypothetical protein
MNAKLGMNPDLEILFTKGIKRNLIFRPRKDNDLISVLIAHGVGPSGNGDFSHVCRELMRDGLRYRQMQQKAMGAVDKNEEAAMAAPPVHQVVNALIPGKIATHEEEDNELFDQSLDEMLREGLIKLNE